MNVTFGIDFVYFAVSNFKNFSKGRRVPNTSVDVAICSPRTGVGFIIYSDARYKNRFFQRIKPIDYVGICRQISEEHCF